nr:GNAT family N-acetyltransferase [Candidatus Gracilibacteria bacterium]
MNNKLPEFIGDDLVSKGKIGNSDVLGQVDNSKVSINRLIEIDNISNLLSFDIYSPGGNITCLIESDLTNPFIKKLVNQQVIRSCDSVEQVGFINLDSVPPKLEMAGGEFCGNATRSLIYKYFGGKKGEGEFQVSGVERNLKGGIDENLEVWTEMPIFSDINKITQIGKNEYLVEMEGIVHLIKYLESKIYLDGGIEKESEVKQNSLNLINRNGLDKYPAAGVIYVSKIGNKLQIQPFVFVRDLDQIFAETACGSGSTALGLVEALKLRSSITDLEVLQPSGDIIKVTADYNNNENIFNGASIKGKVKKILSGKLPLKPTKYKGEYFYTNEINNLESLGETLNNGLIELYKKCFEGEPYNELFSDEDVREIFLRYFKFGQINISKQKNKIIGFSSIVPLLIEIDVLSSLMGFIKEKGLDINMCKYVADLGVDKSFRKNGIGINMILDFINIAKPGEVLFMRTSEKNIASWNLFRSLGFIELTGIDQQTESLRQDGELKSDRRIFSYFIKK